MLGCGEEVNAVDFDSIIRGFETLQPSWRYMSDNSGMFAHMPLQCCREHGIDIKSANRWIHRAKKSIAFYA